MLSAVSGNEGYCWTGRNSYLQLLKDNLRSAHMFAALQVWNILCGATGLSGFDHMVWWGPNHTATCSVKFYFSQGVQNGREHKAATQNTVS